jgi:phi LC3 family holin
MLNWKLRIQNKATLTALVCTTIALVYQILGIIGVTPPVSENVVVEWVGVAMTLLVKLGIIVDPTTLGIKDTKRAMSYLTPNFDDDEFDDDDDDEVTLEELLKALTEADDDDDDDEPVAEDEELEDPEDDEVLPQ